MKCFRTPMVHCCLLVLFFASNYKKEGIVLFLALPSLPDVTHCCSHSLFSYLSIFPFCCELYIQSPSLVRSALLFIHAVLPLSPTNASPCHVSLPSMCCPFISLLSLPPSSFISLPLLSWCRILISSNLTRRDPSLQLLQNLCITPNVRLLCQRHRLKTCLNWQAAAWLLVSKSYYN